MIRIKQNEHGFSVVEAALSLVIVVAIGSIGWYVYHVRHNSNQALDAANSTSNGATPRFANSKDATDNSALQSDLNSASSAAGQGSQNLSSANNSLNDKSTLTTVPQ